MNRPVPKVAALIVLPPLAGYGPDKSQLLGAMDAPPDWELELHGSPEGGHKRPQIAVALPPGWCTSMMSFGSGRIACRSGKSPILVPVAKASWGYKRLPLVVEADDGKLMPLPREVPELLYEVESQTITEIGTLDISACPEGGSK